jgi:tetratricopeptide (TPR) repeat protein
MKRIALLVFFSTIFTASLLAQNSAVNRANRHLEEGKLDLAKEYIDQAIVHDKTMNRSRTWFAKAKVYEALAMTEDENYKNLANEPMLEAAGAYKKVMTMERENSFQHLQASEGLRQLWGLTLNKGAEYFEQGEYEHALEQFETLQKIDPQDTTGYLYAGISAMQAGQYDVVTKNYYKLLDMGYKTPDVYTGLIWIEKTHNDNTDKALELVREARVALPNNLDIMREEINLLLGQGKNEEALTKTEQAVQAEPDNYSLFYILAYLYDEVGENVKAEENYRKSLEINPEYFDANYNLAVLYFNRGVAHIREANQLSLEEYQRKGKEIRERAKVHLEASLPYLLKSHELKPDDSQVVEIIQTIYAELGMTAKAAEFKKKLDAMGVN